MNKKGSFDFQTLWEVVHKGVQIIHILSIVVLHRLLETSVQIEGKVVVFVDSVEDQHFLLELSILYIVILQYGRKGTGGKRKGDHTNDLDSDTEILFKCRCGRVITIPHSCNSCHSEVKRCKICLVVREV